MTKIFLCNNAKNLELALEPYISATVEAEYGDVCVEGVVLTLAHHGPRKDNPPPCTWDEDVECDAIGLSHIDLDTLGGVLAIVGEKPNADSFWKLAGWVDVNGPHKLAESGASEKDLARLHAWWAWNEDNKVYPPRDGSAMLVNAVIRMRSQIIHQIIDGDEDLLQQGQEFKEKEEALSKESIVSANGEVLIRRSAEFVNHLYANNHQHTYKAVVALKTTTGEITLSLADPIEGVSCADIAQLYFGFEAGGHAGIAGSPRSGGYDMTDVEKVARSLNAAIEIAQAEVNLKGSRAAQNAAEQPS